MSSLRMANRRPRRRVLEPPPGDGRDGRKLGSAALTSHKTISLVAALGLCWPLAKAWGDMIAVPSAGLAVVALWGGWLWLVAAIATAKTDRQLERLDNWLLVLGLLVLVAWAAVVLHDGSSYGTDEAAFEQGAASLLLHGHDPYGASLAGSLAAFSTPSRYLTYTMSGGIVSSFGYPALPLLIMAPFVELTGGGQGVPIADVCVLVLATVALFRLLGPGRRGLAVILCVAFPVLGSFALSGLNAVLAMAALLPVAVRWTSTGETGTLSRSDRLRALCLGLALSTNQLAWFIAPFLVSGIYLLRCGPLGAARARRVTGSYLMMAAATFATLNLPFILWSPGAWARGVGAPLLQHAIPYGQGLVDLTLFLRVGGGALDAYDYAAGFLYLALLIVYLARFRTLARACFLLPLVPLFVSGRSLSEYWMAPIAVIAAGALTGEERSIAGAAQLALARFGGLTKALWWGPLAALLTPAAVCLGIALSTPQPLSMRIISARSSPRLHRVQELRVYVRNQSGETLRPHFASNVTGQAVVWEISQGPAVLAPGRGATYRLDTSEPGSMPLNSTPFVLEAVTGSPRTISSTAPFVHRGPVPESW